MMICMDMESGAWNDVSREDGAVESGVAGRPPAVEQGPALALGLQEVHAERVRQPFVPQHAEALLRRLAHEEA